MDAHMNNTENRFPETATEPAPPSAKRSTKAVRLYRAARVRVDYFPNQAAMDAIERLRKRYPNHPVRAVLDALIREGDKVFSGNARG